jgi:glycosyltransferase involved in cell wall biosynthesis
MNEMYSEIHLVYPCDVSGHTPGIIGRELAGALSIFGDVYVHDWISGAKIFPKPNSLLIGHINPCFGTTMRKSWGQPWKHKYLIQPFNFDLLQCSFLDKYVRSSDGFFAITGPIWKQNLALSPFSSWESKIEQLDLGINPQSFPSIKMEFSENREKYSFLYIGHTGYPKRIELLESIAREFPNANFGWVGSGRKIVGFHEYGFISSNSREMQKIVAQYDFLIFATEADANATIILEAMSWGLIPVIPYTSGFTADDTHAFFYRAYEDGVAMRDICEVFNATKNQLDKMIRANQDLISERYTWEKFNATIIDHINIRGESKKSKVILHRSWQTSIIFKIAASINPYKMQPKYIRTQIAALIRRKRFQIFRKPE